MSLQDDDSEHEDHEKHEEDHEDGEEDHKKHEEDHEDGEDHEKNDDVEDCEDGDKAESGESWLEDPSASSEPQNDPQKLFELKYKTSENDSCYIRCKNSNSDRLQDARRRPPAASGPNR